MRVIMVTDDFIKKLKENMSTGYVDFMFVTADGNNFIQCKVRDRFTKGRKVRCSEDNEIFKSKKEAAYNYSCSEYEITKAIDNFSICKGRHFHYWVSDEQAKKFDNMIKRLKE